MSTKYTRSIEDDFTTSHAVATDRLTLEIQASDVTIALDFISTTGDSCDIWFKDDLSPGDELVLAMFFFDCHTS